MPSLSRRRRPAVVSALLLLAVLLAGCGERNASAVADPGPAREPAQLFLAGIETLWRVDTATEDVRRIRRPELGAGDPPELIARVGDKLAMWNYDVTAVPVDDPAAKATTLAENGWLFIPGAEGETIWVGYLDRSSEESKRDRRLSRLREIDSSGAVVSRGRPPGGRASWPVRALDSGLLFYRGGELALWDPVAKRRLGGFSSRSVGDVGPAHGDLLASSSGSGRRLTLSDYASGSQRSIRAPDGWDFAGYQASFSPDGSTLAVPIHERGGWRAASTRPHRLALVDVATGETRIVPGSKVLPGYVFTAFADDGSQVFLLGGGAGKPREFVSYRLGERRAQRLDVEVDDFYDIAVG